eukprot:3941942-Rhodomonas_salina.2
MNAANFALTSGGACAPSSFFGAGQVLQRRGGGGAVDVQGVCRGLPQVCALNCWAEHTALYVHVCGRA